MQLARLWCWYLVGLFMFSDSHATQSHRNVTTSVKVAAGWLSNNVAVPSNGGGVAVICAFCLPFSSPSTHRGD